MKKIICMVSLLFTIITYAQIGGFNANTNYATNSRMIRYTNRLLNRQYTAMPTTSSSTTPGAVTGSYLATYGAASACGGYSSCTSHKHKGLDQSSGGSTNVSIYSPIAGVVTGIGGTTGKICIYNSYYNFTFIVLHCSSIGVSNGSYISAGAYLGKAGAVGASAVHIHTEIRPGNVASASCACPTSSQSPTYDPCIVADLFTPAYSTNPGINSFTACPSASMSSSCATFLGSSVLKARVTSISNGIIYFSLQKCSGTFNSSGTGYLKISNVCGSVVHSVAYSAGATSMSFSAPLLHSQGTVTYYLTVTSSTGDRYYASPISISASMANFPSIADESIIESLRLAQNNEPQIENDIWAEGLPLENGNKIQVFPNPSSTGLFSIKVFSENETNANLKITDITGKEQYNGFVDLKEGENIVFPLTKNLPTGIYSVNIYLEKEVMTYKFIIE